MRYSYSINGHHGGPLIRDVPVYDSGIIKGQALTYGADDLGGALINITAAGADFVGVSNEAVSATTVVTSGTLVFAKVILSPDAVYRTMYDPAEANDISVVSSTSTATTMTTNDDDLDGSWIYINSGTGQGQLGFIGAASATVMTLDTTEAWTTTPDSTSDAIIIRRPWNWPTGSGIDLDPTFSMIDTELTQTGEFLCLENYIEAATVARGQMRPRQHHMLQNLHNSNVKFYSDLFPTDSIFNGATTMATS